MSYNLSLFDKNMPVFLHVLKHVIQNIFLLTSSFLQRDIEHVQKLFMLNKPLCSLSWPYKFPLVQTLSLLFTSQKKGQAI